MINRIPVEWKLLNDYEGIRPDKYMISNRGWIKNVRTGIVYREFDKRNGYHYIKYRYENKIRKYYIHRLVLDAFSNESPIEKECAHLDGSRDNNFILNLKWVSRSENQLHRRKHGTSACGEKSHFAKLTSEDVVAIRAMYATGKYSQVEVAEYFKTSQMTVSDVCSRRTWQHL